MKNLLFAALLFTSTQLLSQNIDTTHHTSITALSIIGTWENVTHSLSKYKSNEIGKVSSDQKTAIPLSAINQPSFVRFEPNGTLIDLRFPNAKWTLLNDQLFILPEFAKEFKAFLTKDDSTGISRITISGETFIKKMFLR